jgi:recombinational DNA repair protein RecR
MRDLKKILKMVSDAAPVLSAAGAPVVGEIGKVVDAIIADPQAADSEASRALASAVHKQQLAILGLQQRVAELEEKIADCQTHANLASELIGKICERIGIPPF